MKRLILIIVLLSCFTCVTVKAEPSWRFIVITDTQRGFDCCESGINDTILGEITTEILTSDVDLVLVCGDIVNGSGSYYPQELTDWLNIMQPVYDAGIGVYPSRGNHEESADNYGSIWQSFFGNLPDNGPPDEKYMTYSFTHKNAFIVALDAYSNGCIEEDLRHKINQDWLGNQLASNTNPHIFVYGHEAAFKTSHPDCLDDCPIDRDIFWQSIKEAGAKVYFCGHDHHYDHARIDDNDGHPNNDVHQVVCGSAGGVLALPFTEYNGDNSDATVIQEAHSIGYGYVVAEVNDAQVTLTWMQRHTDDLDIAGIYEPNDAWSYTISNDIRVTNPNGGEKIVSGKTYDITWEANPSLDIETVLIEYSDDNGFRWNDIGAFVNSGLYEWNPVAPVNSDQCLIRISDLQNNLLNDTSDNTFTIFQCNITIAADLNGDCYVNIHDLVILSANWLRCGNGFDASCIIE